jgi:hypothetical protein
MSRLDTTDVPMIVIHAIADRNRSLRRLGEPVTVGVPMPRGACVDTNGWVLRAGDGTPMTMQADVLDRWSDGSVRWALIDFLASVDREDTPFELTAGRGETVARPVSVDAGRPSSLLAVHSAAGVVSIDTGTTRLTLDSASAGLLTEVTVDGRPLLARDGASIDVTDLDGHRANVRWRAPVVEQSGPVSACVRTDGEAVLADRRLDLTLRIRSFAGLCATRWSLTVRNPRRAAHPDGFWELGDSGSVLIGSTRLGFAVDAGQQTTGLRYGLEPADDLRCARERVAIVQHSSGGENWRSPNHINRDGEVPLARQGFSASVDGAEIVGRRASPIVLVDGATGAIGVAVPAFWENFPRAIEADRGRVVLAFWPEACGPYELQGGEQKTHEAAVLFGRDTVSEVALDWCRSPLVVRCEPAWYSRAQAVPYLVPAADDPHATYLDLVGSVLDGADSFEAKRERVDEYGWRHFGDIYGDHEAVYPVTPVAWPLVSHYNNQYDPVAGFATQFMRTGDVRWWRACEQLARHVVDIDIYHTDEDKSAYNHGLFWHTVHYVDAGKANHRTYPKAKGSHGGGPASEQNYPTGLMLHYFVTGERQSRDAAIGLAQFVVDMDDGTKTIFRWLDRGFTGLATQSGNPLYHGPGRGSGNSLSALVDGYRLTGDRRFLDKAEQIIRRCVHPCQDIDALNLLDAERKWFYTMFLQALAKYLDHKAERDELDEAYAYGRETLLHFARWMAAHEYPYLQKSEILVYPTETWPAQDLRKYEVFQAACRHAEGDERARFVERAAYFFDDAMATLSEMPTRTLARPLVLLLSFGFSRAWFLRHGDAVAPKPRAVPADFGPHPVFVPQKVRAMKRAKMLVVAGGVMAVAVGITLLYFLL